MAGGETDGAAGPDGHRRFARHLDALAGVAPEDEAGLVASVLRDPDETMAQSAVGRHLDNRARALLTGGHLHGWVRAMTSAVGEREFLTGRLREWALLAALVREETWSAAEVTTASDWFQRRAVEMVTSPRVLALLAAEGGTRRVRVAAGRRRAVGSEGGAGDACGRPG
ncbi:hypothetical protein ACFY93_26200 [Streptomyces sp. NPDC008313]|uniref:hypothetical protein n=1 Tax=Streptomyces sp. NPDC008313 TaxID=3364826 RepID=UPI0036F04B6B